MAQITLNESNTEFLRLAPGDATVTRHIFGFDQKLEPVAPDQGGIDVKTCAVVGQIANKAINPNATFEVNPAALVRTQADTLTMFVHDTARLKLEPMP